MIAKMCHEPGCSRAAEGWYCEEHRAQAERRKAERATLFKGTRRKASSEWNGLYRSKRWRDLRFRFLAGNPCCAMCGGMAATVDHIVPHRGDESLFWDEGNLQALCASCHSRKTLGENGYFHGRKG